MAIGESDDDNEWRSFHVPRVRVQHDNMGICKTVEPISFAGGMEKRVIDGVDVWLVVSGVLVCVWEEVADLYHLFSEKNLTMLVRLIFILWDRRGQSRSAKPHTLNKSTLPKRVSRSPCLHCEHRNSFVSRMGEGKLEKNCLRRAERFLPRRVPLLNTHNVGKKKKEKRKTIPNVWRSQLSKTYSKRPLIRKINNTRKKKAAKILG